LSWVIAVEVAEPVIEIGPFELRGFRLERLFGLAKIQARCEGQVSLLRIGMTSSPPRPS
jgi:hypothetical protein